jgi:hypothetical protein
MQSAADYENSRVNRAVSERSALAHAAKALQG